MNDCVLKLANIHASYGKKEILRGVSLQLAPGEVVGLLGENGTGKSTILRVIAGLLMPSSGRIEFQGRDVTRLDPMQRQELGLGYLMQGGRVFPNLTVHENYHLAERHRSTLARVDQRPLGSLFPALETIRDKRAGLLSGGQRQMLSIEMASQRCGVLGLWDEPTAGLSEDKAELALNHILRISRPHMAQLIVEQRSDLLTSKVTRTVQIEDLVRGEEDHE